MSKYLCSVALSLVIISLLIGGCSTTGTTFLEKELREYGFTMYKPPRSNRGPGWVFHFVKTFDGHTVLSTVCETLYKDQSTIDGSVVLPNIKRESSVDISSAIDLLAGIVKDPPTAQAGLKDVTKVVINWGPIKSIELSPTNKVTRDGKRIKVDEGCYSELENLKARGELGHTVFVVQEALVAQNFKYNFDAHADTSAKLKGQYKSILGAQFDGRVRSVGEAELEIRQDTFIGFIAVALENWLPTGDKTAKTAVVSGKPLSPGQVTTLLGQ